MRWRRLCVAGLGAVAVVLAAGFAYAYLTATGSGAGTATTAAVTLDAPVTATCDYPKLVPGDLTGSTTCSLSVTYTGSTPAWMSLSVAVRSRPGSIAGGRTLFDGNVSGLTFTVTDGHRSFTVPSGPGVTGGTCPSGFTCWDATDQLAAWYSSAGPALSFANGNSVTWRVTPRFADTAGNAYQAATAAVVLTARAVQTAANPLPATCTTSTIGTPCPPDATFSWS